MPVDGRTGGDDAVVVLGVALRFHQSLATARRAAHEIGSARGLAVERLRQRLTHHRHLMDAEVRVVLDGMPVQPAVSSQGKAPATPFVSGVGGGCRVARTQRPAQAIGIPAEIPTPAGSLEPPIPALRGQGDEHLHPTPRGGMSHGRSDTAGPVRGVELDRIDGRVRERDLGQVLVRDHRRAVREGRLGRRLADLGTSDGGWECEQDGEYPQAMSREPQDRRKGHCKRCELRSMGSSRLSLMKHSTAGSRGANWLYASRQAGRRADHGHG